MSDNLQITEPIAEAIGCLNRAEMLLTRNDAFDKLEQLVGWSPSHYAKHWRERAEKAEAEVERLRKDRYPFQSFDQFCNFLTSTNLIDELAVSDSEGWDGGAELSRIETAFDRYLDQTNQ